MFFSGAWGKVIHEKAWSKKSCDTVPFRIAVFQVIVPQPYSFSFALQWQFNNAGFLFYLLTVELLFNRTPCKIGLNYFL
jgi:hypothetical protein